MTATIRSAIAALLIIIAAPAGADEPHFIGAGGGVGGSGYLLVLGTKQDGQGCDRVSPAWSGYAFNCVRLPNGGRVTAASLVTVTKYTAGRALELGVTVETCSGRVLYGSGGVPVPIRRDQALVIPPGGLALPPGDCVYFSLDAWADGAWGAWAELYLTLWVAP